MVSLSVVAPVPSSVPAAHMGLGIARAWGLGSDGGSGWRTQICRALALCAAWLVAVLSPGLHAAEQAVQEPTYATTIFGVYDGLPNHGVPVTCQTSDGYMWFGTESGLARFDGVRFVTFSTWTTPELPSNLMRRLFEDRDGWLWIATQGGLCRYRNGRFERVGLTGRRVCDIAQDHLGHIWVATQDDGVLEYRNGTFISHAKDPGMPAETDVRCLFIDSNDRVWVFFLLSGGFYLQDGAALPYNPGPYQFRDYTRVIEHPRGTLWISHGTGLLRVRNGEVRNFDTKNGLDNEMVRGIYADQLGQIWVATNNLYMMRNADEDHFIHVPVPDAEHVRNIMQDREGSYWIGTAGDGVARMRPSAFHMIAREDRPLGGSTRTVSVDANGNLWAGLTGTGFARLEPTGQLTTFETPSEVWCIWAAADGAVWVGMRNGLAVWRNGVLTPMSQLQRVRALFEDRNGTVWIGSETDGVTTYRNGEFKSLTPLIAPKQKIGIRPVAMVFAEGPDGTVYAGIRDRGGIVTFKGDTITVNQDLPSNDIRAIYPDAEGNVWVGTKGRGLLLLRDGKCANPDSLSLPFSDQVAAVIEDADGRVWLGTPKGIMWTSKANLIALAKGEKATGVIRLAVQGDGVRPGTVGFGSSPAAIRAPDGRMWFTSRHGIVAIDPKKLTRNSAIPPVQIERVVVNNQPHFPIPGKPLELAPGTRSLDIEYTALSFIGPDQVFFRYQLEGRDPQLLDAGTRRTALYADLRPGKHRFRVLACNDDGVWNQTGATVDLIQLPFFYQTGWFYGGIALALVGVGLGLYRWRTASLRQHNTELEQRIVERTAELAKSYEAIRASEYFYHSLVESLPQVILRKDIDGRFTYANSGFAELVNRPLETIVGQTDAEVFPPAEAEKHRADDRRVMQTRQPLEYESVVERTGQKRYFHVKNVPLIDDSGRNLGVQILSWDMTSFREIEEKLKVAQRELVETSRLAGIAEMATGILHNLGNALNSVNTTASLTATRIRESKVASIPKIAEMLAEQNGRLPEFFAQDRRGQQLPVYLSSLGELLMTERTEILQELDALQKNVDHIKEMVAAQQQYARVAGISEVLNAAELVEFALRLSDAAMKRLDIEVERNFMPAPAVKVERQKALQIVGNLLNNAKDALKDSGRPDRRIIVGVRTSPSGRTQIFVTDNGMGIAPENLSRIFGFGFTTKKTGHGFGLHSSALAASELGGSLTVASDGVGKGATFTLELPPADE